MCVLGHSTHHVLAPPTVDPRARLSQMAKLQGILNKNMGGGMGGGGINGLAPDEELPLLEQANRNMTAAIEKNAGEADGGSGGKSWRWEQSSKYGESEVLVRFALAAPATKKDVKVTFTASALKVVVAGDELINGKTFGRTYPDDSTWCLVEKGAELQVMLALGEDVKWKSLLAE